MENTELEKKRKELEKKKECLTKVARHHIEILKIMQDIVGPISRKTVSQYEKNIIGSMELLLGNGDSNIIDSSIDNVLEEEFNNKDEAIQKG